jgi:hypothetical protein
MSMIRKIINRVQTPFNIRKSDVTVDYTNGGEYVYFDPAQKGYIEYFGFYYKLKSGQVYLGADFKKKPRIKLKNPPKSAFDKKNGLYYLLTNDAFDRYNYPQYYYPRPTADDYKKGVIQRMFVQKKNEPDIIIEINMEDAKSHNNRNREGINAYMWSIEKLQWTIAGTIDQARKANERALIQAERSLPGIKFYLTDLDELHKDLPILNNQGYGSQQDLYTNGGEFKLENGEDYVGPYHIHPTKGAMVGSKHSENTHDYLYPY